jgi:hypothetical protein
MILSCKAGDFFVYYIMAEIVKQGEVDVAGTILYIGGASSVLTKIFSIKFYNSLAYRLILERYDAISATSKIIYELNLSAGDSVTDDFQYALKEGDELIVYSNIPGTTYYIYGIDYASS